MTTSDLTDKFGILQQQLAAQHAAVMDALALSNATLAAIAAALGAPPPGDNATLDDVLNVLSDIHTDTMSLDGKLLRIRDAIAPLGEAFPTEAHSSMLWSLYRIMDAINPTWPRPTSIPLQPAVDLLYNEFSPMNRTWWQSILGISTTSGDNMLDWLSLIAGATISAAPPLPPVAGSGGTCDAPYISDSAAFETNRTFARWPSPPTGLLYSNTLGLLNGCELSAIAPHYWTGWSLYVMSKDATSYSEAPSRPGRYPMNQWRLLDGELNYPLAVSVDGDSDIVAYLCGTPIVDDCYNLTSHSVAYSGGGSGYRQMVVLAGFTMSNQIYSTTFPENVVHNGDLFGTELTWVSGGTGDMIRIVPENGGTFENLTPVGASGTYNSHTGKFIIYSDSTEPFVLKVCPPV